MDAASVVLAKSIDLAYTNVGYQVQEQSSELHPLYKPFNLTFPVDQSVMPSQLGLFISQPSNMKPLYRESSGGSVPESRYGLGFGYAHLTKKRRGSNPERFSLFSKVNKGRNKDMFHRYGQSDYSKQQTLQGSDRFLTPEFVKFKNEIERDTEKTHLKGLKMSKDSIHSPTIVYENPKFKKFNSKNHFFETNPIPLGDESFRKPQYDEPNTYDDSTPFPKSLSHSKFSSSISNEPYQPPNLESSDLTFPPYPPLPPLDNEPYPIPRSELEARNQFSFNPSNNDFPSSFQNHNDQPDFPLFNKQPVFPKEDDDVDTTDEPHNFGPELSTKSPRKYIQSEEYRKSHLSNEEPYRPPKPRRNYPKRNRFGRPYGSPAQVPVPASKNEDDEDDFDSNYETPADAFDENLESEEEEEPPKARLRQSSRKLPKRVQQPLGNHRKRCVKKFKEMSVDDIDDEPNKEMSCLVCENLDTGGTYETCSYESDPNKNSYYVGNAASFRKGNSKAPHRYRFKRQIMTTLNETNSHGRMKRHSKKDDTKGSYTADPEDFGAENFSYDDNEELQDDSDDDELEEYKPQPPAYANEHSCKQVIRNGASCMICRNPETNGKYEQCSYANDPDDSYEYAQSSSYGKSDVPYTQRFKRNLIEKPDTKLPLEWKELRNVEQGKIKRINEIFKTLVRTKKEQPDSEFLPEVEDSSYEEKFLNLFPEMNEKDDEKGSILDRFDGKSLLSSDENIPGFETKRKLTTYFDKLPKKHFLNKEEDSEMSKMMKEFKSKDRSKCKKKLKDKMTCYVCNDKDGMKREECMYVVENEPTKASYSESNLVDENVGEIKTKREVKKRSYPLKYKYLPPGDIIPSSQTVVHKTVEARKYGIPTNQPNSYSNVQIHTEKMYSMQGVPTETTAHQYSPNKYSEPNAIGSNREETYKKGRTTAAPEEDEQEEDPEETGEYTSVEVVPEADPSTPDGAFSDDTETVYDPEMKTTLPKFMVEKSEHEKIIDDFISTL